MEPTGLRQCAVPIRIMHILKKTQSQTRTTYTWIGLGGKTG